MKIQIDWKTLMLSSIRAVPACLSIVIYAIGSINWSRLLSRQVCAEGGRGEWTLKINLDGSRSE